MKIPGEAVEAAAEAFYRAMDYISTPGHMHEAMSKALRAAAPYMAAEASHDEGRPWAACLECGGSGERSLASLVTTRAGLGSMQRAYDDGSCCEPNSGDCCGPGSWCCARAGKHDHDEKGEL